MSAMPPEPVRLPGIGLRLDLVDDTGSRVSVVRRKDGTLEIHARDEASITLDATQAWTLGALASGHLLIRPDLFERAADVMGGIELDWVTVPATAGAAGRTIEELAIRRRTGATIVAILRGPLPLVAPDPHHRLEAGDDLVFIGRPGGRDALERLLRKGT